MEKLGTESDIIFPVCLELVELGNEFGQPGGAHNHQTTGIKTETICVKRIPLLYAYGFKASALLPISN